MRGGLRDRGLVAAAIRPDPPPLPPSSPSGTFVLANVVYNGLTTTHAFEIYANGELVFSKLATGRLPSPDEFWAGLTGALGRQPIAIHPAGMGQQQRQQRMHP